MDVSHITIYKEDGIYAGWPANHGKYQWGNELLFGFIRGKYGKANMHNILGELEFVQARSLDGGLTWNVEETHMEEKCHGSSIMQTIPEFDLNDDDTIIKVRGKYDHGGEMVDPLGAFHLSLNRGKDWQGPFPLKGLEENQDENREIITSRTRTIGNYVFYSKAILRHWGSDSTYMAKCVNGKFKHFSTISDDMYRAVMPDVVQIDDKTMVAVLRRHGEGRYWIECYLSKDSGENWKSVSMVGETGTDNGNPPALIFNNGTLFCTFANRTEKKILCKISHDCGVTWEDHFLRENGLADIGYPQLFDVGNGKMLCVYYWADKENPQQHIAGTFFKN
jgi:hypothetical protein